MSIVSVAGHVTGSTIMAGDSQPQARSIYVIRGYGVQAILDGPEGILDPYYQNDPAGKVCRNQLMDHLAHVIGLSQEMIVTQGLFVADPGTPAPPKPWPYESIAGPTNGFCDHFRRYNWTLYSQLKDEAIRWAIAQGILKRLPFTEV